MPTQGRSARFLDRLPGPVKVLLVFLCLYFFMVGIRAMGDAFKLMGDITWLIELSASPLVSLFIGILATTLVQSSSVTTSAVVPMAAFGALPPESAFLLTAINGSRPSGSTTPWSSRPACSPSI